MHLVGSYYAKIRIFYVQYICPENRAVYEIMWKNAVQPEMRQDSITRRARFACWIIKATNARSEYVITTFPLEQWLRERPSVLHVPCLSYYKIPNFINIRKLTLHLKIHLNKVKVVLIRAVKVRSGNRDLAPLVLNLATRWK